MFATVPTYPPWLTEAGAAGLVIGLAVGALLMFGALRGWRPRS